MALVFSRYGGTFADALVELYKKHPTLKKEVQHLQFVKDEAQNIIAAEGEVGKVHVKYHA